MPSDQLRDLEFTIRAGATAGKTMGDVARPFNTRILRVVGLNISHPDWRQSFARPNEAEPVRRIVFVASKTGALVIRGSFSVHASATPRLRSESLVKALDAASREAYLMDHPVLRLDHPEVTDAVAELMLETESEGCLPDSVFEHVSSWRDRKAPIVSDGVSILV